MINGIQIEGLIVQFLLIVVCGLLLIWGLNTVDKYNDKINKDKDGDE